MHMRKPIFIARLLVVMCLVGSVIAQDEEPQPQISKDPLTAEQIAVYQAVLKNYLKGDNQTVLNLANRTEPVEVPDRA